MLLPQISPFSRFGSILDLTYGRAQRHTNVPNKHYSTPKPLEAEQRISTDIDQKIKALDSFFNNPNIQAPSRSLPPVEPKSRKHSKNASWSFLTVARKSYECIANPPVGYYNPIYITCSGKLRSSSFKVKSSNNSIYMAVKPNDGIANDNIYQRNRSMKKAKTIKYIKDQG